MRESRVPPYLVFLAAFAVYLATASPLITAGDSGELVAAAFTLGIAHPPGYPLYALLGKLASLLPFGNVAFRLNIMSGALTALCAMLIYMSALELTGGAATPGAVAAALAWAFTGIPWSQSAYAEVYPAQLLFSLAALFCLVKGVRAGDIRLVFASCLSAGLSVSAHYGGVLFLPVFVFYALWSFPGGWVFRKFVLSVFFFILGLSPYFMYLPVRASRHAEVNWGNPDSLSRLVAHLLRLTYGDLSSLLVAVPGSGSALAAVTAAVLVVAALAVLARRHRLPWEKVLGGAVMAASAAYAVYLTAKGVRADKLGYLFGLLWSYKLAVILPLFILGCIFVFRKDRVLFFLLMALTVVVGGVSVYRVPTPGEYNFQPLVDKFFMPPLALVYLLAAAGAAPAWLARGGRAVTAASYSLMLIPAAFLASGFGEMDRSRNFSAYDYAVGIMRTLPEDAVFLAEGDNHVFLCAYMKSVENMRPDVGIYSAKENVFPSHAGAYAEMSDGRRPVYSSLDTVTGITLEPAGLLNRFPSPYGGPAPDPWKYYSVRVDEARMAELDFESRQVLAEYYFAWARDLKQKGRDREEVSGKLDLATSAGHDLVWTNVGIGRIYLSYGEFDKAYRLFRHAVSFAPYNPEAHAALGNYYILKGMPGEAEAELVTASGLKKDFPEAFMLLARVREEKKDYGGAVEAWKGYAAAGEGADVPFAESNIRRLESMPGRRGNNQ